MTLNNPVVVDVQIEQRREHIKLHIRMFRQTDIDQQEKLKMGMQVGVPKIKYCLVSRFR